MQSKEDFLASFSFDKEIERANWYKNDLEKGGWTQVHKDPGSEYWIKTFPEEEVPIKVLGWVDVPISAEMFMETTHEKHLDKRNKWDQVFVEHEVLETYPDNQGTLRFSRFPTAFPLWDRSFILFNPPPKEIDWFGKRAFIQIQKNAWHPSKPEGADGLVRATNGGNFTVMIPDEKEPSAACKFFLLSNNNYNGWLPHGNAVIEYFVGKKFPASFNKFVACVAEGYHKYVEKE